MVIPVLILACYVCLHAKTDSLCSIVYVNCSGASTVVIKHDILINNNDNNNNNNNQNSVYVASS